MHGFQQKHTRKTDLRISDENIPSIINRVVSVTEAMICGMNLRVHRMN